eukprot:m.50416 g.50416  ORF g.50416 m.50416 type:complete len:403 (+) comp13419_c0_seq1:147-1355(+)
MSTLARSFQRSLTRRSCVLPAPRACYATSSDASNLEESWRRSADEHFPNAAALNNWMTNYYKLPLGQDRSSHVVGALMTMLDQHLFSGPNSLASSVFWAHLLQPVSADDCTMLFNDFVHICNSNPDIAAPEEQCDTFLRALFWRNDPEIDVFLENYRDVSLEGAARSPSADDNDPIWQVRLDLLRSHYPADAEVRTRLRQPVPTWELPVSNLPGFKAAILDGSLMPYNFAAFHQFRLWDLQQLSRSDPAEFSAAVLPVAGTVSGVMLDALSACYYATGDKNAVFRVVQIAGEGLRKMRELNGESGVTKFIRALMANRESGKSLKKLDTDAASRVLTQVGASACLSLLSYSSDEVVWNLLQARSDELKGSLKEDDIEFVDTVKMVSVIKAAQDIAKLQEQQMS